MLRGYSILDGTTLRHWIYDSSGRPVYFGSEIVQPRSGIPPDKITIPAALLAATHQPKRRNQNGASHPPSPGSYMYSQPSPRMPPVYRAVLRHDGATLHIHPNGRPTLVWSDGIVDVWADSNRDHVVLPPGSRLRFPQRGTIHALSRSRDANFLFYRPIDQYSQNA